MTATHQLHGRDRELDVLGTAFAAAGGNGRALLLTGDPGVGKSALLEVVADWAGPASRCLLRTDGTPGERRLPFAGLDKLLRPVLPAERQSTEDRRTLTDVLQGAQSPASSDIFRVGLSVLRLVAQLAGTAPVVLLVDDAHWLDPASLEVLAFVARRLDREPALLVVAERPVDDDRPLVEARLPELVLGPLDEGSARSLLDAAEPGLSDGARAAVLATAAGNPLGLLELPKAWDGDTGGELAGQLVPMTRRLERAFAQRALELPRATRELLLVAALNDSDSLVEVVAATALMTGTAVGGEQLGPAIAAGLAQVHDARLRFRHPLVRSAFHQASGLGERHAAHAALAQVVAAQPDRRAWHRASSVLGTDEGIAAELEQTASRALHHGSVLAAVHALQRAAQLSEDGAGRGRRLLRAAELAADAGRPAVSSELLRKAHALVTDPRERLRYEAVVDRTDEALQGGADRVDELVGLAGQAQALGEEDLATQFLVRAAQRCWHLDFGPEVGERVVRAADRLGFAPSDVRRIAIDAWASPFARAAAVLASLAARPPRTGQDPVDHLLLGYAAACVGAYAEAEAFCSAAARVLREEGRLALLAEALSLLAWATLRRSRWSVAEPAAAECVQLARETRQPIPEAAGLAALALIAGIRGDLERAETLGRDAERLALASRNTIGLAVTHLAQGITAAGAGRLDDAFAQLWRLYLPGGAAHQRMQACRALGSLAEVAVLTGHEQQARAELDRYAPLAALTPTAGVDVAVRYARALLAAPEDVEAAFEVALAADWSDWPFEHGRALLAYGSWLRRHKRVVESRARLRAARDAFTATGARLWAERAQSELRAAGEGDSDGTAAESAWERLTPQEREIVQLVLEGLSNREIGLRLYLSPRTIGSHLYRVFPKLGISSRAQLVRALTAAPTQALQES